MPFAPVPPPCGFAPIPDPTFADLTLGPGALAAGALADGSWATGIAPLLAAGGPVGEPAPGWVMTLFAVGMLLTYAGVAFDRLHKTVAALGGALVMVLLALNMQWLGEEPLFAEYGDLYEVLSGELNIFAVIIGTGILVDVVGKSGLFHFISIWIVRLTHGRAGALWLAISLLTFALVAVLTTVPATLILCSLVLVICRSLEYSPRPYLLTVAICANSGALATFASGLPNILVGAEVGIPYVQFLQVSLPYAVFSLLIAMGALRYFFRHEVPWKQTDEQKSALDAKLREFDPWSLVESRWVMVRSALILALTVLGFAFATTLGLGVDYVAMAGGVLSLLFAGKGVEDAIGKVNLTVILFFTGLFLVIGCVEATGALEWLARQVVALSGGDPNLLVPLLAAFSAVASAFVDNIPVAATLIPIVESVGAEPGTPIEPLWWTLILSTNLGGNATPIGSISCVIALYTLKKEAGVTVGWGEFIKIGGTVMVLQVIGIIFYILALQRLGWIPDLPGVVQ
ncbi:ArsB/NhaD family transporter [Alienimonas californiensis]|uniref:Arsenical pump membrane protein n=1 Tax=Alienimonas californiensis TaxID=2527989 RepID=A0A517P707_9PLAN|nr:ArsB/NhaD family transporter [Alienimonas californiensis]QDT15145.1 Arsenical pump membrane protein [Alienimonas californiensis]